ncbi:mitogen-activated protein kinase kinase kinase 19 isoform X2 [Channa argus]|uniref:mitogen-activated protein kinase kinase kinase 19 isoform X2 n=1 Tax=Channa argus TaxID=215402 RepID=UPI00351F86E5
MERSEKTEKLWQGVDGMLKSEQEEEIVEVSVVNLAQEDEGQEELESSDTKDKEEQGYTPLITACRKGMTEVVQGLLQSGADLTLCDGSQQTALHISCPELRGKMLSWMSRPHLPPQTQLLQASWQGDLHSLQHLLAQTDGLDVNAPNSDGVTPVMLAVRDIDLFEDIAQQLPWEHRPVEVVKELLGLSADLQIQDHRGRSGLLYASKIDSTLKDEIIHMMVEALHCTALALNTYSYQDLVSFGDLDMELDIKTLYPNQLTGPSTVQTPTHQCDFLEMLESPGCPPASHHHKGLSQDKGIPLYFQNAMETLRDIREAYQDAERGSRRDFSLPSMADNSRRWSQEGPVPSFGLLSPRTPSLPVPPKQRQRKRSVVSASRSLPVLLSVAEPKQLSQSAPSITEPLLSSNSVMQARAHIQTRLGSHNTANDRKGSSSALHPRTPKLLAPLDRSPRDDAAPLALKHHVPLKPISRSPLSSMTQLRREVSRGSSHTGSLTAKGGSEESGSSSSCQSSIDLEDEDEEDVRDIEEKALEPSNIKFAGDRLLQHSKDMSSTNADFVKETKLHFKVQTTIGHIPPIHRSLHSPDAKPIDHASDLLTENDINYPSEGKAKNMHYTKVPADNIPLIKCKNPKQDDTMNHTKDSVNNDMPVTSESKDKNNNGECTTGPHTEISHENPFHIKDVHHEAIACSKESYRLELHYLKQTEEDLKDPCDEDNQLHKQIIGKAEDAKLKTNSAMGKTQLFTPNLSKPALNLPLSDVDPRKAEKMVKALKPVRNKGRITSKNYELGANFQTNQSFNVLTHKDRSTRSRNRSKSSVKYSLSTQVKDKCRKSPDILISGTASATKVKSKFKSVKDAHCNAGISSPRRKIVDLPQSKRENPEKFHSSKAYQHTPLRELKSAQDLKKNTIAGTPRSKSAVDVLSYKDMFQQIQTGDEGPAIYEMFAGPVYDNLRVSSTCEKTGRQVQSVSRNTQRSLKVKHRPLKQPQCKLRRCPGETVVVSAKTRAKHVSPRAKPHLIRISKKGTCKVDNFPQPDTKLDLSDDMCQNKAQKKIEDHMLPTIEEALSRYGTETLKSVDTTLTKPTGSSHAEDNIHMHENMQETIGNSSNRPHSDPVLPLSPQPLKINTWTSSSSSSSSQTIMSPVYQRFLDDVGDGPLTDDLLQCLAEELISLDERDVTTIGPCPDNLEPDEKESNTVEDAVSGREMFCEVKLTNSAGQVGSDLVVDETITWTKGEILGRGAYGTVYCGLTSQGQLIAVKQVSLDTFDPDAAKREYDRLQGEVELLKTLRHTHIVGFLGTSLYQHVVSIFMEYIPGGSIASILHRFGPLPERVLALYTLQILKGVDYLHVNRVIHRDLKGNNLMLMPTGVIKLIDFGCARRISYLNHSGSNSRDLLKSVHGTPYWMAPEVISETGYGRKSDIWSIGCTVFEMATGKPPLAHMDKLAAMFYIGARRGAMPSLPDWFSDNAKDFVKVCLTSDQRLRPSAEQLLKHSFIPQNETVVNSWETQKNNCCSHPEGLCN